MAKLNRADIIAQIDLLINDNNNKEITALDVRTVLKTISQSDYNLIDDDALEVFYDPTEDLDWDAVIPTEAMAALDQLAKRMRILETNNASPNVAYVSTTGSDVIGEFELGNPLKPYATFEKAFLDVPASNFIIQSLGGTFTETFTIVSPNSKSNFILRLDGTIINGDVKLRGCTDGVIYLGGGTINGELDVAQNNSQNISVFDGTINGLLRIGENCNLSFCRIVNSAYALIVDVADLNQRPFISNCYIESTNGIAYNGVANFNTCFIKGNNTAFQPSSNINPTKINKFTNCNRC